MIKAERILTGSIEQLKEHIQVIELRMQLTQIESAKDIVLYEQRIFELNSTIAEHEEALEELRNLIQDIKEHKARKILLVEPFDMHIAINMLKNELDEGYKYIETTEKMLDRILRHELGDQYIYNSHRCFNSFYGVPVKVNNNIPDNYIWLFEEEL